MSKNTYIWDLDGTLINSYEVIVSTLLEVYKEFGLNLDPAEIHKHVITYSVIHFTNYIEETYGITFEAIKERYGLIAEEKTASIKPIKNAPETLKALFEDGASHFIFTHRGESTVPILTRLGIAGYFKEILNSQSGFPRKPAPDAINYLIDKYKLSKENTFYIGDRTLDMDCAANAGIKGILFLEPDSYCEPNGKESYIVHDLPDIVNIK